MTADVDAVVDPVPCHQRVQGGEDLDLPRFAAHRHGGHLGSVGDGVLENTAKHRLVPLSVTQRDE